MCYDIKMGKRHLFKSLGANDSLNTMCGLTVHLVHELDNLKQNLVPPGLHEKQVKQITNTSTLFHFITIKIEDVTCLRCKNTRAAALTELAETFL